MKGLNLSRLNLASLLPIIFAFLLFPIVWITIAHEWFLAEQDNTHAFPAFLAALFIAVTSRYKMQTRHNLFYWLSCFCLVSVLIAYLLVQIVNIEILTFALMTAGLVILYVMIFGTQQWLKSLLIVFLVIMALPIWDALLEPLVVIASGVVTKLVSYLNIAVLIEGNSITTPYGRILIAEGCSGIRYLMVSTILATVVSHTNHYKPTRTIVTIGLGILIGLVANWARITLLILIGYYSEMQSNLMHDHEMFGWVIFALFIMPAMYFAPHKKPTVDNQTSRSAVRLSRLFSTVFILFLFINGALFIVSSSFKSEAKRKHEPLQSWQLTELPNSFVSLPIQKTEPLEWYRIEDRNIYVGVLYNSKNDISEKLVPYLQQSLVNEKWFLESEIPYSMNENSYSIQIIKSLTDNKRFVRAQLFKTGTYWSSSYSTAKIQQISAVLSGKNDFSYFLLLAECKSMTCSQTINVTIEQAKLVITQ